MNPLAALARSILRPFTLPVPRGMGRVGQGARIHRPRRVEGAACIEMGESSQVLGHGWLCCIEEWRGRRYTPRLRIGDRVYIGHHACITCLTEVVIEDDAVLSEHVYLADSGHGMDPRGGPIMAQPLYDRGPVRIGAGSFVGYRASILPGGGLGRHCVVGAHAVVTRVFPDYTMVAGVPARVIKRYDTSAGAWVSVGEDAAPEAGAGITGRTG